MFNIIKKLFNNDEEIKLKKQELELKKRELEIREKELDISDIEVKKELTQADKKAWGKRQKENKEKGKQYESFLSNHFNNLGYEVDERGKRKGKKDKGIDLLLKKDNIYTLVQCKNYAQTTKINHSKIKEFNSNCLTFIEINENILNKNNTKFLFIIPNKQSLKNCALKYFEDDTNKCQYEIIEVING